MHIKKMESQKFVIYSREEMKVSFSHSETADTSPCPTPMGGVLSRT